LKDFAAIGQSTVGVIQALIFGIAGLLIATLVGRLTGWLQGLGKVANELWCYWPSS